MDEEKRALADYVEKASDLAESVKRNIIHRVDGFAIIDDETVNKLNDFIIASNRVKDLQNELECDDMELN